jgi:hypothetical protein
MRTLLLSLALLAACGPDVSVSKVAVDADNDGYDASIDCEDSLKDVHPEAPEFCDGVDNDCNGLVDDDTIDGQTWYPDNDGDGYGDPADAVFSCDAPGGYVLDGTDCDDAEMSVNPGGTELCDGLDNDCNTLVDDDAVDALTTYPDADLDGHGDPSFPTVACEAAEGYVGLGDDCDDTNGAVNPGAPEVCDDANVDEDCDDAADDADASTDATGMIVWYADADSDTYGDARASALACDEPAGYGTDATDCDDAAVLVNPAAAEVCDDAIDNDCDGETDEDCGGGDTDTDTGGGGGGETGDTGDTGTTTSVCDGANTGATYIDGTSMGGPGLLLGMEYTPASDVDVARLEVFTGEGSGTNTIAIWSDDAALSQPDVELDSGSWSLDRANDWQGADLSTCLPLTAGTTYWIVWAPVSGSQATWDTAGTSVTYRGSFDGGATWNGPFSDYVKYSVECCE